MLECALELSRELTHQMGNGLCIQDTAQCTPTTSTDCALCKLAGFPSRVLIRNVLAIPQPKLLWPLKSAAAQMACGAASSCTSIIFIVSLTCVFILYSPWGTFSVWSHACSASNWVVNVMSVPFLKGGKGLEAQGLHQSLQRISHTRAPTAAVLTAPTLNQAHPNTSLPKEQTWAPSTCHQHILARLERVSCAKSAPIAPTAHPRHLHGSLWAGDA